MLSLVSAGGTGGFLSLRAGEVLSQVLAAHGSVHRSLWMQLAHRLLI